MTCTCCHRRVIVAFAIDGTGARLCFRCIRCYLDAAPRWLRHRIVPRPR